MAAFDPDAYLAEKPFDPDAYLGQTKQSRTPIMGSLMSGALRGAGEIGSTILRVLPNAIGGDTAEESAQRRKSIGQAIDQLNEGLGVSAPLETAGKLGAEVAGTAGVGGVLARGASLIPGAATKAAPLIEALRTGGMAAGGATGLKGVATRALAGAGVGAGSAGLINPSDAGMGAVIGGMFPVVGAGLAKGAGKVGNALRGDVAPEVRDLYQKAQAMGVQVPADRLADSRPLNAVAAALNYVPFSGRAATETAMNAQLNRAASRTFGQDSSNLTTALGQARNSLGAQFEKTLTNTGVNVDKQLMEDLANVYNKAESELGRDALKPIESKIAQMLEKGQNGVIDGKAAYVIKRDLDRIAESDAPNAFHAKELQKTLMSALNRSLGPEDAQAFSKLREQYGNMLDFQFLAKRMHGSKGELSAARIANMDTMGNQSLQDVADVAAQFVRPREGAHGAAQRAAAGLITLGMSGAPALATGAATGRAANMALNSNLAKQLILNEPTPILNNQLMKTLQSGGYRVAPLITSQ